MLNTIFGTLSAGAGVANSYESISTVTVGAGGSASISFTSIPSTYSHLQIRIMAKQNDASAIAGMSMNFNSDTTLGNYPRHELYGTGSSVVSGGVAAGINNEEILFYAGSGSQFGPAVVDILDYANTNKYKTARALCGVDNNGSGYAVISSGAWLSTSAVNTITIASNGSTLSQYSSFALYGIKGS